MCISCHFGFVEANFCQKYKITQFFSKKFKITHSEAHFVKKLWHEALTQVKTPCQKVETTFAGCIQDHSATAADLRQEVVWWGLQCLLAVWVCVGSGFKYMYLIEPYNTLTD